MALSIFVPLGYITFLVFSLSIFSKVYRKRTAEALVREHGAPWFAEGHPERDIYQTLVQAAASSNSNETADKQAVVPDVVLKAALLNRAMADVRRIIRMRDDKQALQVLLQKGSIGDETMAKFGLAEKELEAEILDVVSEANTFREGWGQLIFPTASEMVAHLKHRDVYHGIEKQREHEVKRLTEAGKPVPQPTVALPPLITPAGTSITIGGPPPGSTASSNGVVQGPPRPPIEQGVGGASKSGTVEEDDEDAAVQNSAQISHTTTMGPMGLDDGYAQLDESTIGFVAESDDEDEDDYGDGEYDDYGDQPVDLIFKDPTPNPSPVTPVTFSHARKDDVDDQRNSSSAQGEKKKKKKKRCRGKGSKDKACREPAQDDLQQQNGLKE